MNLLGDMDHRVMMSQSKPGPINSGGPELFETILVNDCLLNLSLLLKYRFDLNRRLWQSAWHNQRRCAEQERAITKMETCLLPG
jgi:hypothetical protein